MEVQLIRIGDQEKIYLGHTLIALNLAMNFAPFLAKTLKLAMYFAPFLAKNFHLSIGKEFFTFPWQKFAP